MRIRVKIYLFLLLILLNLSLIFISPTVKAEEYQLGFADKTRLTLIYEYTDVDPDLLEELADTTEDEIYEDLSQINEGDKLKLVISNVDEQDAYWLIKVDLYTGKNLDKKGNDFETEVYKKPKDLADEILDSESEDISSFYFIPTDAKKYLHKLEDLIIETEEYQEVEYELSVDDRALIFDYTPFGYADIVIQEYGEDGVLVLFRIMYYDESVFSMELINCYEDYSVVVYNVVVVVVLVIAIFSVVIVVTHRKEKKQQSLGSKEKINEMLNDIK